jgi:hypothetical protein
VLEKTVVYGIIIQKLRLREILKEAKIVRSAEGLQTGEKEAWLWNI